MASLTKLPLVTHLSDRVIRILACNPGLMTLQGTNTYLVGTGPKRLLIDTGDGKQPEYIQLLKYVLKKEDVNISDVYITHWHEDHIGGLGKIKKLMEQRLGSKKLNVWKGRRLRGEDMTDTEKQLKYGFYKKYLTLQLDGITISKIATPGHTSDHYSFYLKEEEAIFSGDCVLGEGTTVFEDLSAYMESLHKLLKLKPKVIYPGHGPVVKNTIEHIQKYIDHREARDLDIIYLLDQLGRPLSEKEITERIYKNLPEALFKPAMSNVMEHLHKLRKEGRVHGNTGEWYTNVFCD